MSRKSVLKKITLAIVAIGFVLFAFPFVKSLSPHGNSKSSAGLPRIDVSKMQPGDFVFHPYHETDYNNFNFSIMLYKKSSGEILAFSLPTRNGNQVGMPDLKWWKPFHPCKDFGIKKDGETEIFACLDSDLPGWWSSKWRWDTEGKSFDEYIQDMPRITGSIQDGYFILFKRS
jgi:hypothetical protein